MAIANVILTNTFDEWRTRTNQVIVGLNNLDIVVPDLSDKTNTLYTYANTINDKANVAYIQANTARDQANVAYVQANTGRTQANTARDQANVAFNQANAAFTQANVVYVQANTARDHANAAFNRANIAHSQANTARDQANAAFDQANVAFVQANIVYNQANTARINANAAFMQANAAFAQANAAFDRANVITTTQIVNGAVTADKIGSSAVTAQKIAVKSVDGTKIALGLEAQGDLMYYDASNWVRLPAGNIGEFLKTGGPGANPSWANTIISGEEKTATGSSLLFENIPANVNRINILFYGVRISTTVDILVQIGDDFGIASSLYYSISTRLTTASKVTTGFHVNRAATGDIFTGKMTLDRVPGGGTWISTSLGVADNDSGAGTPFSVYGGGYNSVLVNNLTKILIKPSSGTGVFNSGSIILTYE